jgi:hypothetical protein
VRGQLAGELIAEAFLADVGRHLLATLRGRVGPVGLQPLVLRPELILVDVAVLDDQRGDALGRVHRKP